MTLKEALAYGQQACHQSETATLDAQLLLMHVLDCSRSYLYTWPERELTASQQTQYQQLIQQRAEGRPVAHLLGNREFWSLSLEVNDSTLIPRPDTEVLVEQCLALPLAEKAMVLELGTGSGAIALALASERPQWSITALDQQPEAVELAKRNTERLALTSSVCVVQSDWYQALSPQRFDLIVSNPPYIRADDPHLQLGDLRFEPATALISAAQGLADIEHIIDHGRSFLVAQGWLALEHGFEQGSAVRELFSKYGYISINTRKDYANLERVTYAQCNRIDGFN